MDKEVDPAVLAVVNEKRLRGEKRTPVEIIARMGVPDAREKAAEQAWLATGDNVIVTLWAELISVGAGGRWFYLESLDAHRRASGGERSALQSQRIKDRLQLLKRSLDAGQTVRAVLQTNRVAIADIETDKAAKVSTRVPDEEPWHVAQWDADHKIALLVRGAPGWQPDEAEMQAALSRGSIPAAAPPAPESHASHEEVQAGALAYLARHFAGYGYKAEQVAGQGLGYDIEVSDKKGNTLLKLAVKGVAAGFASFQLSAAERDCAKKTDPWRLAVVSDPLGAAVQHKLYKASEIDSAPGLEA